jgi:hypothetical protein
MELMMCMASSRDSGKRRAFHGTPASTRRNNNYGLLMSGIGGRYEPGWVVGTEQLISGKCACNDL